MKFCPEDVCFLRGTDGTVLFQTPYLMSAEITFLWANTKQKETHSAQPSTVYISLKRQTQSIYCPLEKRKCVVWKTTGFDSLQHIIIDYFKVKMYRMYKEQCWMLFRHFVELVIKQMSLWRSEHWKDFKTPECNHNNFLNIVW